MSVMEDLVSLGLCSAISATSRDVYQILRAQPLAMDRRTSSLIVRGRLSDIGEVAAISRGAVSKALKELRAVGWVGPRDLPASKGSPKGYVLGELVSTAQCSGVRVFYADHKCSRVLEGLRKLARHQGVSVSSLELTERAAMFALVFEGRGVVGSGLPQSQPRLPLAVAPSPRVPSKATQARTAAINRSWAIWKALLTEHYPEAAVPVWKGRDRKHAVSLLKNYGEADFEAGMVFLVCCWTSVTARFTGGKGVSPSLSLLECFASTLVNEGKSYSKVHGALRAWREWSRDNPNNPFPPEGLRAEYTKAKDTLTKLGISEG